MNYTLDYADRLKAAVSDFVSLRDRVANPNGKFDKAGRFYLADKHDCCQGIRGPSRSFPFSEMVHGRTAVHVAHVHGVDPSDVRKLANGGKHTAEKLAAKRILFTTKKLI